MDREIHRAVAFVHETAGDNRSDFGAGIRLDGEATKLAARQT